MRIYSRGSSDSCRNSVYRPTYEAKAGEVDELFRKQRHLPVFANVIAGPELAPPTEISSSPVILPQRRTREWTEYSIIKVARIFFFFLAVNFVQSIRVRVCPIIAGSSVSWLKLGKCQIHVYCRYVKPRGVWRIELVT